MSIKLIAVDMDGTFLSDQKTYNRERFMAQYQQMKAQGIRFVVASGNQYYQLISFFPEIAKEGANKRGNSSRLTQSFHFFMFEPIFSPVNALNQPI